MKIIIQGKLSENGRNLVRRCGYGEIQDYHTGQISYIRQIGGSPYPRFHLYINQETENELILNLHLDQRKPSYAGSHAHGGEYESEIIENEAKRIRGIIGNYAIKPEKGKEIDMEDSFWKKLWQKLV